MKKVIFLVCFLAAGMALSAEETFESMIVGKEVQQVYGNGALSVVTEVYAITVVNNNAPMRIELSKDAYDLLQVGDLIRITLVRGWFSLEIKAIALLQSRGTK